jgi:hypothetical protein
MRRSRLTVLVALVLAAGACCGCSVTAGGSGGKVGNSDILLELSEGLYYMEYANMGQVELKVSPGDAEIWIDDGLVSGKEATLHVPAGTHEFRAVWPDGTRCVKRIYVKTGLPPDSNFKSHFKAKADGFETNVKLVNLVTTEVILTKPD